MLLLQTTEVDSDVWMTGFHFWMISFLNHHNCMSQNIRNIHLNSCCDALTDTLKNGYIILHEMGFMK